MDEDVEAQRGYVTSPVTSLVSGLSQILSVGEHLTRSYAV